MTEATDATVQPADFSDEFDAWISGATLSQKSIEIYGNMGLFAEYEQLERELKLAQSHAANEEASMEDSDVADIEQRMVELYEKWQDSKSTWTVRGITRPDSKELSEKYPDMPLPKLDDDADADAREEHAAKMSAYEARSNGRNYAVLERTILKVAFANGKILVPDFADDKVTITKPAITAAQLETLRERLGEVQFIKLIRASQQAATSEPVIPAPFLRSNSKADPT